MTKWQNVEAVLAIIFTAVVSHDINRASIGNAAFHAVVSFKPKLDMIDAAMTAAEFMSPSNEGKDGVLVPGALADFKARLVAEECFVHFDDFAFAAYRRKSAVSHSFANAVAHKPSGLYGNAKHPSLEYRHFLVRIESYQGLARTPQGVFSFARPVRPHRLARVEPPLRRGPSWFPCLPRLTAPARRRCHS